MSEAYAEWLVKRKAPAYAIFIKIGMGILCAIGAFLALTTPFGIIILTVIGGLTYLVFRNMNLEYEYLYVTGQLTIDKIMGQSKRKKAWEGTMDEIQIIAPSDSYVLKDYETSNMKLMDFSSGVAGAKTYTLISQSGSNSSKVIFEPNDRMLQCFRQTAPRKVIL